MIRETLVLFAVWVCLTTHDHYHPPQEAARKPRCILTKLLICVTGWMWCVMVRNGAVLLLGTALRFWGGYFGAIWRNLWGGLCTGEWDVNVNKTIQRPRQRPRSSNATNKICPLAVEIAAVVVSQSEMNEQMRRETRDDTRRE